jgi:hypothetical protein
LNASSPSTLRTFGGVACGELNGVSVAGRRREISAELAEHAGSTRRFTRWHSARSLAFCCRVEKTRIRGLSPMAVSSWSKSTRFGHDLTMRPGTKRAMPATPAGWSRRFPAGRFPRPAGGPAGDGAGKALGRRARTGRPGEQSRANERNYFAKQDLNPFVLRHSSSGIHLFTASQSNRLGSTDAFLRRPAAVCSGGPRG